MARLIPGRQDTVAMESISSRMLLDFGINDPDFMPTIYSMFAEQSPLVSILDAKGYKTRGVNLQSNFQNSDFRTMTSNHVQYKIAQSDYRVEHFRANVDGVTYVDYANPTQPGLNKEAFYIFLDSNIVGGYEIVLLADGQTQLFVVDKDGGKDVGGGVFRYRVKVDGNNPAEYVDPSIMQEGDECQAASSKYPHDFSTGGNEKYYFSGYGDAYMTLQRFKYSYSGTAMAMSKGNVKGRWVSRSDGKGGDSFITDAQWQMMKMLSQYMNFQLLEGKGTVAQDTKKIQLTNDMNQEILSGSGVLYSGDGAIEKPINKWTMKAIEALLQDADTYIRPNELGEKEAVMILHPTSYNQVMFAMESKGVTQNNNIVGDGDDKVLNRTYAGYTMGGLTIWFTRGTYMQNRPAKTLKDGTKSNEHDSILLPLGLTEGGSRGIQLIQLRPLVEGTVAGINEGGEVSNDVDGTTKHALIQNGVISQVQPIKTYKPIANNLIN